MAMKPADLDKVYKKYQTRVDALVEKDPVAKEFFNALTNVSTNEISSIARQEIKIFDNKWIDTIAEGLSALDAIIKDPKKFIKTVGVLTPVELARKTNAESVRHLASHSQYVKNVDEYGNVTPDKILNIESEDDYAIYENRFIKTLINKLLIFVERRYDYIIKHADTRDTDIIIAKSKLTIGETVFECEQKVKISNPSADEGKREYNQALLDKISDIRKMVRFYADSDLMRKLKEAKPVPSPIQQTNTIRKNKNYHRCYELFKFLDSYDKIGLSIKVKEDKATLDVEYLKRVYYMIMFADLTLETSKKKAVDLSKVTGRKIKPKINKLPIKDSALSDARFEIDAYFGPSKQELARKKKLDEAKKKKELAHQKLLEKQARERERKKKAKELAQQRTKEAKERAAAVLKAKQEAERKKALELKKKGEERLRLQRLADLERKRVLAARKKVAEEARRARQKAAEQQAARLKKAQEKEKTKQLAKKQKEQEQLALKKQREEEQKKLLADRRKAKMNKTAVGKEESDKVEKVDIAEVKKPVKTGE